jgi:hypothetical protein
MQAFSRALGSQPGVELAPIEDRTGLQLLGDWDQTCAIIGRFPRGRIDAAFVVSPNTFLEKLGKAASVSPTSLLGEAHSQAKEALRAGARRLVVSRLVTSAAAIQFASFTSGAPSTFAVGASIPASGQTFTVKHLGCHSDGIKIAVHADEYKVGGVLTNTPIVTVRIMDADGNTLHEIRGSLTAGAQDEFNQSIYLPDLSEAIAGDMLEWTIPAGGLIDTAHDCYGRDSNGRDKWVISATLACFTEGGTGYTNTDYDAAVTRLRNATEDYGYILGGGSRAVALLTAMGDLAFDTNRQFLLDAPGEYTPAQVAAFVNSLGFTSVGRDHYPQIYWAPFKSYDPLTGIVWAWGTSAAQAGYRCGKNRNTNAYGLSAKHEPVAGARGNVGRREYRPLPVMKTLTEQDLSDLADARVNPVLFRQYASGSFYTYTDTLTAANTRLSWRKLVTVAEMSSYIDEMVVRFGNEVLQTSMTAGIRQLKDFLERFFSNCLATEWLVDIGDPQIPPYFYTVEPSPLRPADAVEIKYWLHYNGLIRQARVKQIIV